MPKLDEDGYLVIGKVTVPGLFNQELKYSFRPAPRELDILSILCEHVNKIIPPDVFKERIGFTDQALYTWLSRIGLRIHPHWAIQIVRERGIRILYLGEFFENIERTYFIVDFEAVRRSQKTSKNKGRERLNKLRKVIL